MNLYFYLNYKVYKYYLKKRDSTPVAYSFMVPVMLVYFNLFSIFTVTSFFFKDIKAFATKLNVLLVFTLLSIINYLLLYKNKRYEDVFNDFDILPIDYKVWNFRVKAYIISSVVIMLIILVVADQINQGNINFF
jgi:hypothetical protein